ncbi:hypothetical protein BB558_005626 [Smittium angustum]|uniref:Cyclin-dependent kinase 8 n=1 Tax=Smittium angustum TaxID=133377 RepID=A0A2U1IZX6_SMIAN|nr:hypothetical protein BB558_007194 [Smittium angustum]PVZ98358.1 hypothetical protein BB558_005626 [Smittium angustum]
MEAYKLYKQKTKHKISEKYDILGFISAGTYGKVFKAKIRHSKHKPSHELAIKQFKPEGQHDKSQPIGISQSACREIALCRELNHINVVFLQDVMMEDGLIHMVLRYAEYDLLTMLQYHKKFRKPLPELVIKSMLFQTLEGVNYLHNNGIMHRDLKPANLLVDRDGLLKVGDLGLARLYNRPFLPLYAGDKVVVTIWYRAPELILGSRHYTTAVDMWAIGCIFGEMLTLRPMFNGEEVKMETKKVIPFQKAQMIKICEIMGSPSATQWPELEFMPELANMKKIRSYPINFRTWFQNSFLKSDDSFSLLSKMLEYNPNKRISAQAALTHSFFKEDPTPVLNPLQTLNIVYPERPLHKDEKM